MTPKLPSDMELAVELNHGVLRVDGERASYVIMTMQAYREMAGVGTEAELTESLEAISEGLADINAGRTRSFREVFAELGSADEVRG